MKKVFLMLFLVSALTSCSVETLPDYLPVSITGISGQVQKGPFSQGTTVYIQPQTAALTASGTTVFEATSGVIAMRTSDSYGSFEVTSDMIIKYIDFIATGYYYDEVEGALSDSPKTLTSFAYVPSSANGENFTSNVNILTSLARSRALYLYSYGGTTAEEIAAKGDFDKSLALAQKNVLSEFNITAATENFYTMDIQGTTDSDAILLATSCVMQGDNTVAGLTELESKFKTQIEIGGVLISGGAIELELASNAKGIPLSEIRQNLDHRYKEITADEDDEDPADSTFIPPASPPFENWVDSSGITNSLGSKVVNSYKCQILCKDPTSASCISDCSSYVSGFSTDTYLWNKVIRPISCSGAEIINATGSYAPAGVSCTKTTEAPHVGRTGYSATTFDNKIWLMGGTVTWAQNDVWYTTDGINWIQTKESDDPDPAVPKIGWANRKDAALTVHDGKMYIMGGDITFLYFNDVWSSSDGVTWTQVGTLPEPRSKASAVSLNGRLWLMAGVDEGGTGQTTAFYSDNSGVTWAEGGELPISPECAEYYGATTFADRIWLFPGYVLDVTDISVDSCSDTETYSSTDGTTWVENSYFDASGSANYALVPFDSDGDGTDDQLWKIAGTLRAGTGTPTYAFSYITSSLSESSAIDYTTYVGTPWQSTWFDSERAYLKDPIAGAMRVNKYDSTGAATGTYYNAMWLIGGTYGTSNTQSYDAWFFKVYDNYDYIGNTLIH